MATSPGTAAPGSHAHQISLQEAVKLLSDAHAQGIGHVVSVLRDPANPSRILSITAAGTATA